MGSRLTFLMEVETPAGLQIIVDQYPSRLPFERLSERVLSRLEAEIIARAKSIRSLQFFDFQKA